MTLQLSRLIVKLLANPINPHGYFLKRKLHCFKPILPPHHLIPDICVELLLGREVGVQLLYNQLDEKLHPLLIISDAVNLLDQRDLHLILDLVNPNPALSVVLTFGADL